MKTLNGLSIFFFLLMCLIIPVIMLLITWLRAPKAGSFNKEVVYECGFGKQAIPIKYFNVLYYRIALSFVLFDLEIILLLPLVLHLPALPALAISSAIIFIFLLIFSFIYEWQQGLFSQF